VTVVQQLPSARSAARGVQRGGFFTGLVIGIVVGLAVALGVALYVTKVPVPFMNKVPQRTPEQDAAEREKNKNWDPNAPLVGKGASKLPAPLPAPGTVASGVVAPPMSTRDPASILADRPQSASGAASAASVSSKPLDEAFSYFVQTGAYSVVDDAEAQRGKLALLGFSAKVTEREQSGRMMYRVRVGPFEDKAEADGTKERLTAAGFEPALVRAPKR